MDEFACASACVCACMGLNGNVIECSNEDYITEKSISLQKTFSVISIVKVTVKFVISLPVSLGVVLRKKQQINESFT